MVINYFFNIELSEALYPALQAFEIALRNAVHRSLTSRFADEYWFDRPELLLTWQRAAVSAARTELSKHSKPHDPGRIVAELNFGFWHSMFNRPYETGIWHARGASLLKDAFPHLPRRLRTRQDIWDRCNRIRKLRNRVFHYEPVWNRPDLAAEHAETLDALGWISAEMHDAIAMCDRFPGMYAAGRSHVAEQMSAYLASG